MDDLTMPRICKSLFLADLVSTDHPHFVLTCTRGLMKFMLLVRCVVRDMEKNLGAGECKHPSAFWYTSIGANEHTDTPQRRIENRVAGCPKRKIKRIEVEKKILLVLSDESGRADQGCRIIYIFAITLRHSNPNVDR